MKQLLPTMCAMLGIVLALSSFLAGIKTIFDAIIAIHHLMGKGGIGDPAQLSAIIGETIVGMSIIGISALIPALLIYVSLVHFRLRLKWFFPWARLASLSLLLLLPFGTISGGILLVLLKKRKSEFEPSGLFPDIVLKG